MSTVLIADACDAHRSTLKRSLAYAGYRCIEACDGHEALEMIQSHGPDLVLFDVALAQLDGLGLLAALTQLPASERPATIAIGEPNDTDAKAIRALHGVTVLNRGGVSAGELRVLVGFELDRRSLKAAG